MQKYILPVFFVLSITFAPFVKSSQQPEVHAALRQLKETAISNVNAGNIEALIKLNHPNVVVTSEASDVIRGHEGIQSFYKRLFVGPPKILNKFTVIAFNVDEPSILHGENTAIAFGSAISQYDFADGRLIVLPSRWSATLVKQQGHWLIASFHNSVNLVDNPVLLDVKRTYTVFIFLALLLGVILGMLLLKGMSLLRSSHKT